MEIQLLEYVSALCNVSIALEEKPCPILLLEGVEVQRGKQDQGLSWPNLHTDHSVVFVLVTTRQAKTPSASWHGGVTEGIACGDLGLSSISLRSCNVAHVTQLC